MGDPRGRQDKGEIRKTTGEGEKGKKREKGQGEEEEREKQTEKGQRDKGKETKGAERKSGEKEKEKAVAILKAQIVQRRRYSKCMGYMYARGRHTHQQEGKGPCWEKRRRKKDLGHLGK